MNRIEQQKSFDYNRAKCEQIKELLERLTGFEDIGIKSRENKLPDIRKSYCYLCKVFTKASLSLIGEVLREGFDHATVLHNIKKFNELYPIKQLYFIKQYEKAHLHLAQLNDAYKSIEEEIKYTYTPNPERKFSYTSTLNRIMSKGHSIILKQATEIEILKTTVKELESLIHNNLEDLILDN